MNNDIDGDSDNDYVPYRQIHKSIYTNCLFRALHLGVSRFRSRSPVIILHTHITSAAVAKAAAARKTFVDTQVNLSELLYHSYTNIPPILYENCHSHTAYLRSITLSLAGNFNKTLSGVCETQ